MRKLKLIPLLIMIVIVFTSMTSCQELEREDVVGTWYWAGNGFVARELELSESGIANLIYYIEGRAAHGKLGKFSVQGDTVCITFITSYIGNDLNTSERLSGGEEYVFFTYNKEKSIEYLEDESERIFKKVG